MWYRNVKGHMVFRPPELSQNVVSMGYALLLGLITWTICDTGFAPCAKERKCQRAPGEPPPHPTHRRDQVDRRLGGQSPAKTQTGPKGIKVESTWIVINMVYVCNYIYVCVGVCIYYHQLYIYICECVCVCMYVYIKYIYIYNFIYVCVCACIYILYIYSYIYMCVCVCVYVYILKYIYINI